MTARNSTGRSTYRGKYGKHPIPQRFRELHEESKCGQAALVKEEVKRLLAITREQKASV